MADRARTPQGKNQKPRRRPRTILEVEQLEDRVVPSFFPSTANSIGVFEDQLPSGMSNALIQFMATHTDGTQKQTLSQIDQFRAINPNYTLLHYQLGTGNSTYDYLIDGQWANDFSTVTQQESWFAHQTYSGEPQSASDLSSGRVTGNGSSNGSPNWYQADISNPAWQQYTLNQIFQNMAATGSNGWFADSFTYGIGGAGYNSPVPTRYQGTNAANPADWPGGITWTDQLQNWAQVIENAFAQHNAQYGTDYQFIPNLDARVTSWEPDWYDNSSGVPIMDGAFLEGFGEYTDTYDWTLSMNQGLNFTDNNKIVIVQPYFTDTPDSTAGQQERNFYMGTYLLLKGNQTYINMDYNGGAEYFPEYQLNLGAATTPLPSNVSSYLWNGVYRRDFQNGFVLVNPGTTTYTLSLGGTFQLVQGYGGGAMDETQLDANGNYIGGYLTYQNLSSITLAGGTAAIFLNPTASGPTIATAAAASANPASGFSVNLSVLGQENGSDAGLIYTWSSSGPASVSFSTNATNSAKNTTANFSQAGSYTFTATITDSNNYSITSSLIVTVDQTPTSIRVSPSSSNVADGSSQQFSATAYDQFGIALTTPPTFAWTVASGAGTVSSSGLYTAPATGSGSATIAAASGSISASAAVTVTATIPGTPTNFTAAAGNAQVAMTWTPSTGAASYNVYRATATGQETLYKSGLTGTSFTDTGLTNGTTYYYQITAVNSAGESPPSAQASATPQTASTSIAINAGGGIAGSFMADTYFSGGSTFSNSDTINTSKVTNPAPQAIYDSERYGNFTYTVSNLIPGASYIVRIDFAEIYWDAAGQRLFNVAINGQQVLTDFDIFATAGGRDVAIAESFTATANSSSQILIAFTSVKDNAKVSGIEVTPLTIPPANGTSIDAGGGATGSFVADTNFSGGSAYSTTATINTSKVANPAPQAVFQTERYGNFTYTVPNLTPGASYTVRLDFAEIYWDAAGQRLFNVAINGQQVLTNFDIFATAGGMDIAIAESFPVTANASGQIAITFTSVKDNAKVSGIEITPTTTPPASGSLIDAGGGATGSFVADTNFSGGSAYSTTATINTSKVANPAPQAVFQTERYGNFTYTVPNLTPGASYTVRLDFAEIYWDATGQRLFNVAINGQQVLTNFDIFATAGGMDLAIAESFTATANASGQIVLTFTSVKDNAKVSGIEITPA